MEVAIYRGPSSRCLTRGVPTEAADSLSTTASGDVLSIPVLTLKQKAIDYLSLSRFELCSFGNAAPLKQGAIIQASNCKLIKRTYISRRGPATIPCYKPSLDLRLAGVSLLRTCNSDLNLQEPPFGNWRSTIRLELWFHCKGSISR